MHHRAWFVLCCRSKPEAPACQASIGQACYQQSCVPSPLNCSGGRVFTGQLQREPKRPLKGPLAVLALQATLRLVLWGRNSRKSPLPQAVRLMHS